MVEIEYNGIPENKEYEDIIKRVMEVCFKEENLVGKNVEINVILTTPAEIRKINNEFRKIDRETDVLSFPMFEKEELAIIQENGSNIPEVIGDIVISIEQVKKQAIDYEHSFERELAYMVVHGFYHVMGYDHIYDEDKKKMREKEEVVLAKIGLERNACNNEEKG